MSLTENVLQTMEGINNLKHLKSLYLSGNNISSIEFVKSLSALQFLDLSTNTISDITPLSSLKKLKKLNIRSNSISDLSPFSLLTGLEYIDAYNNKIVILNGVENLQNLEYLDLGDNQIVDVDIFQKIKTIRELYLHFNKIENIKPLSKILELDNLNLMFNNLEEIQGIESLIYLKKLNLSYNKIRDITPLCSNSNIETLDISQNPILSIDSLVALKKLINLKLGRCLPANRNAFNDLKQLKSLDLSNNSLEEVEFLNPLINIEKLELQNNELTNVNSLESLSCLKELKLQNNKLTQFPRWLLKGDMAIKKENEYRNGYVIQNNPIEDVPNEFLKQNNGVIGDYLKSLENGSQPINEIKVIVLGEGAAGKTSLVNYLEGKKFNKLQSQTHGINIAQCGQEFGVTMKIWDFGGQDIMHHTHQLFLTQNSLYVLVLNAREKSDTEKWLKLIKVFGGDSPIIIVTNKIDENPSEHENIKFLNTKYPNIKNRYVRISCESGEGLGDFKGLLNETIKELLHVRTQWGNSWLAVKKELERMRKGSKLKDYIHYDVYNDICEKAGVYIDHRDTLINWLHQLGVVTYFSDSNLAETNVINPSWLTEAFYDIINAKIVADNFGRFNITDLGNILDPQKHPKQKYAFLLGLMTKFELCYQINSTTYLIPDLLKKEEPSFSFNIRSSLKFKFKYSALLPKALLPKFMVRRHQEISSNLNWRTGMVIADSIFGSKALIRIDEEEKEISIFVSGDEKRGYLASILSSFQSINELYDGLEYEELVPCCCRTCKESEKPHYFKYSLLQKYKQKSRGVILCEVSFQDVLVNDLLGALIKPEELEEEISKLIGSGAFKTKNYLENGKIDEFVKTIKQLFSSVSYLLFEKSEKAYHMPLFLILRTIFGNSAKGDEIQAKGRSDIILNLDRFVYIIELKLDGTSQMAIDQIYHNRYYDPYILDNKTIELIGINFSSTERNIESYIHETFSINEPF